MSFIHRFSYFLVGAILGSIVVYFIWGKKKTTFCWLPNCRTLKDFRVKKRAFDSSVQKLVNNKELDTAAITDAYLNGTVDFSRSNTKLKTCKTYIIESNYNKKSYEFLVENCDSIALIKNVIIK
tara:strand:- start:613 stop:984 length:372 start_codon:yes stop_codon:yes gene_type:complete